ncbi:YafY family transcriptional regulator [Mucilaginibacter achroorhodeus]|uniref:YafY family transcriptional regulator n=1 Tax=Mucilaginibacter achroorhodeus TaxID=2599294 RepID=A0A563U2Q8_9SPHI|nr:MULTISPECIES: YafY family protein [Mucilaginibacter]QXV64168.1 YafY family transcriptional regulator [Mucilaginibacter sp. 21P]TWR25619.1 YafY family transcriptional regulator [Mucilaginibacter achroorhodeus]
MNRIDRISAILIQLQSRRVVKASDIAERFGISLRTVYRDVRSLEEAGVPVIGEAGVGYSLVDGYRLPPIMFTREEATAFLTAEKFVEQMTDASTAAQHRSAMYKIRAILKTSEKDLLDSMEGNIEVFKSTVQRKIENQDHIQTILNGIISKTVLCIEYLAGYTQVKTKREIEPIGIFYLDSFWHLIAWCRMRKDYRDFRLDRIQSLTEMPDKFEGKHPTLKDYIAQTASEHKLETVIMRVDKKTMPYLSYQKYYNGFVSEKDAGEQTEMTFLTNSIEGFARWYMMFGDSADIVSPPYLRDRVGELLDAVSKRAGGVAV